MKAILIKPIEGLEVGTYDVNIDSDVEGIGKQFSVWQEFPSRMPLVKEYDSLADVFDDWFVLQELPETITRQIENHLNIALKKYGLDIENEGHYGPLLATRRNERIDAVMSAVKDLLAGVSSNIGDIK